jgi:hypothetical protein
MTPEEKARQQIDLLLQQSGWIVQDRSRINLSAGPGVAVREVTLKTGEADYLLFAGGKAIATMSGSRNTGHADPGWSVLPVANLWLDDLFVRQNGGEASGSLDRVLVSATKISQCDETDRQVIFSSVKGAVR